MSLLSSVESTTTGGSAPATNTSGAFGTSTPWHVVVLWFLGGVALLALADPAPGIATALVLVIILGVFLNNWSTYKNYLGLK